MATLPEPASPIPPARSHWRFILALALVARGLVALIRFHFSPPPPFPSWGFEDIAIALSLHAGHGFSSPFFAPSGPTAFMAPGYPLLLAAIMSIFGTGSTAAGVAIALQLLFSLATIPLVMYLAQRHFDVRTANLAGFIGAISQPMLNAPLIIWDTSLSALLLTGVFALSLSLPKQRLGIAALGALCALAALVSPALIPPLFAVCAIAAWNARRIPWAGILAFLLVFSIWPIRNLSAMHAFIPFRTDFGYELWIGNHPGGNGDFSEAFDPMANPQQRSAFLAQGELAYMHLQSALARAYIRSHPGRFLRLSLRRVVRFWTGTAERPDVSAAPLALLGLAGLILLWKQRPLFLLYGLPLLLYPLPYYITHADARFQYVIDPLLTVLAAHALNVFLVYLTRPHIPRASTLAHADAA